MPQHSQGSTLFEQLSDPAHPARQREWDTFLQRREEMIDQILSKLQLAGMNLQQEGIVTVDPIEAIDQHAIDDALQQRIDPIASAMRERDRQQLIGAAEGVYQIDTEGLEIAEVEQLLEQARMRRREALEAGEPGFWDEDTNFVRTALGAIATGSADAAVRTAETIPFLGRWLSQQENVQELNQWIGLVREAHLGHLSKGEQRAFAAAETASGLVAYAIPGVAAWRLAGLGMRAFGLSGAAHGTRAASVARETGTTLAHRGQVLREVAPAFQVSARSRIIHGAVQAGSAAWMLEGGGDGPISEKALNIGLGIGLGGAFEAGGAIAAGTFGGVAGGIVGASADEPLGGAIAGVGVALGARRAWRAFGQRNNFQQENFSWWDDFDVPPSRRIPNGDVAFEPTMLPREIRALPRTTRPADPPRLPPGEPPPRQLPGETLPAELPPAEAPAVRGLIPDRTATSELVEQFSYRGTRRLFYAGRERPEELLERWNTIDHNRLPDGLVGGRMQLDNTGRFPETFSHIREVEANFQDAFVLTPDNVPLFNQLTNNAQSIDAAETALRNRGFDGLVVQGIDDVVDQVGLQLAWENLGLPGGLMEDAVYAFGRPNQVRFSRTVVDADVLDQAFRDHGAVEGRRIAGIQAATFGNSVRQTLRPFVVGPQKAQQPPAPEWVSQIKGAPFVRDPQVSHPLVPEGIERAILQHHPDTGPRVALLDQDGVAQATLPVQTLDEGTEVLNRLGFSHMDPNSTEDARRLAQVLTKGEVYTNSSMADKLWQNADPTDVDLAFASFIEHPGKVSVLQNVDPQTLPQNIEGVAARYRMEPELTPDNIRLVQRGDQWDVLIGPKSELTNTRIKQYEDFGVFSGMQARTADGMEVRVNSVWREQTGRERAAISPVFSDVETKVPLSYVLPGRVSVAQPLRGDQYNKFKNFALGRFNEEATQAGIPVATDITDPRVSSLFNSYIDEFATSQGFVSNYEKQRLAASLEHNLARDYQRLAGETGAFQEEMQRQAFNETTQATLQNRFVEPDLETLARAKGLIWEPPWRGKHGQLVDEHSNLVVPFENRQAATEFVRNYHRDGPEYVSGGRGVDEAMPQGIRGHAEQSPNGVEFATEAQELQSLEGTVRQIARDAGEFEDHVQRSIEFNDRIAELAQETGGFDPGPPRAGMGGMEPPSPPPPPPRQPPAPGEPPVPSPRDLDNAVVERTANETLGRAKPRMTQDEIEAERLINQLRQAIGPRDFTGRRRAMEDFLDSFANRWLAPMRIWAARVDDKLRELGVDGPTLWRDVENLQQAHTVARNEAIPWMRRIQSEISVFKRADRRLGRMYDILTEPQIPGQEPFAQFALTNAERRAAQNIRQILDELHTEAQDFLPKIGYITDYLPRLRYFTDTQPPKQAFESWRKILPDDLKWFASYARTGNLHQYQKDVGRVLDTYIRGLFFEKHARLPYERVQNTWTDERIPLALRSRMEAFLFTRRHGFPAGHDAIVRAIRSTVNNSSRALNKVTAGAFPAARVTNEEILNAFGLGMTSQYRFALGHSPATIIREILQPFLLLGEHGPRAVLSGYTRYIGNPQTRVQWNQRAERFGWAEPNQNAVVNSEFFSGEVGQGNLRGFSPEALAARERFAQLGDFVHDKLPHRFRRGIEGDVVADPLWAYRTLATNPGRIISGNIGFERAQDALGAFRRREINHQQLMRRSDAINNHESLQVEFRRAVEAGNDEAAAAIMGNESMRSQFVFGIAEQPEAIRSLGVGGRLLMQFGNFALQFGWRTSSQLKNRLKNSGPVGAASYIAGLATLPTIAEVAANETGWEGLRRFNWFRSLTFGGGMMVDPFLNLTRSVPGLAKILMGDEEGMSPEERFAVARFKEQWGGVPVFWYGGTQRTIQGLMDALTDRDPQNALLNFMLTGRGESQFLRREFLGGFVEQMQEVPQSVGPSDPLFQHGITPEERQQFMELMDSVQGMPGGGSRQ